MPWCVDCENHVIEGHQCPARALAKCVVCGAVPGERHRAWCKLEHRVVLNYGKLGGEPAERSTRGAMLVNLAGLVEPGQVFAVPSKAGDTKVEISIDFKSKSEIGMEIFESAPYKGSGESTLMVLTPGQARALSLGLSVLAEWIELHAARTAKKE